MLGVPEVSARIMHQRYFTKRLVYRRGVQSMRRSAISFADRINIGASFDTTRGNGGEGGSVREGSVL